MDTGKKVSSALEEKINELKDILKKMGSAMVMYPGGTSSSFLLGMAVDVLGGKDHGSYCKITAFPHAANKRCKKICKGPKMQA